MGRPKQPVTLSERKIVARILKVRKAGDRAARSKSRFADYRYLRSVLRAHAYFSDNNFLTHRDRLKCSIFYNLRFASFSHASCAACHKLSLKLGSSKSPRPAEKEWNYWT